jgi:NADPH:quinone reductase-like Zn-dependent oxidoreductase
MQAIVQERYGGPEVLALREVPVPVAGGDEVLVKVHASAVNPGDWHLLRGKPFAIRLAGYGLRRPKHAIPGQDMAGEVEAVGKNVTGFRPGDAVFGEVHGAYAEYTAVPADAIARKPANLTFAEAAAVPVAGFTALQGLRDAGKLQPGQEVLINGASGGIGTFAVQIARALGAHVTGVCSSRNVAMVRALGADRVIDYGREDFTQGSHRYDLIFDLVGNRSLTDCKRVLAPTGIYVPATDRLSRIVAVFVAARLGDKRVAPLLAKPNRADLETLRCLLESGRVKPVIGERFTLGEVPEALRRQGAGHARGKRVIAVTAAASSGVQTPASDGADRVARAAAGSHAA